MPSYFFLSLSNRQNLDLCIAHALAGFTSSISGLWTFLEVNEGDFVSFLYGARPHNLYRVAHKEALRAAENLAPWPPVTFSSGKTYYFPFRLHLEPLRKLEESLVRPEFAYVAENLLLRGGYRRTHFQADQTTLQAASQMGIPYTARVVPVTLSAQPFVPRVVFRSALTALPEVFAFHEFVLQTLTRQYLSRPQPLGKLLADANLGELAARPLEVLGEKALPEGHVDIVIKEAIPMGRARKVFVEVKKDRASQEDVEQLYRYVTQDLSQECEGGILIAQRLSRRVRQSIHDRGLTGFEYSFADLDNTHQYSFAELLERLRLKPII